MEIMLDTHLILWALLEDSRLPERVIETCSQKENVIFYSIASAWEVELKHSKRKLDVSGTLFIHYCEQAGFKRLPIEEKHVIALETLQEKPEAAAHKDPFDRMLLAQAKAECMMFMTHDSKFRWYDEPYLALV